ncbi:unnamed protein product [Vitrella brassicaformis CCMP3155]|uniref:RNB domain-containing protein n=2 Tax=Vitrella brassicaformis TaxID=1169539 RepID=A0A0G4H092_VITBC|nr:unnamed protein product [Vitrella brassicaformis CCMP3155]|eukprot:CEM36825.1 unnamed protein product [Vitrella brassicaformis CCMP3155]
MLVSLVRSLPDMPAIKQRDGALRQLRAHFPPDGASEWPKGVREAASELLTTDSRRRIPLSVQICVATIFDLRLSGHLRPVPRSISERSEEEIKAYLHLARSGFASALGLDAGSTTSPGPEDNTNGLRRTTAKRPSRRSRSSLASDTASREPPLLERQPDAQQSEESITSGSPPVPASPPGAAIEFEEYWSEQDIATGLAQGTLLKGSLRIPAFQTDVGHVVVKGSAVEAATQRYRRHLGAEAAPSPFPAPHSASRREGDVTFNTYLVTGFLGRNRAFHGDEVVVSFRARRRPTGAEASASPQTGETDDHQLATDGHTSTEGPPDGFAADEGPSLSGEASPLSDRCRVVGVSSRNINKNPILATIARPSRGEDGAGPEVIKAQPRQERKTPSGRTAVWHGLEHRPYASEVVCELEERLNGPQGAASASRPPWLTEALNDPKRRDIRDQTVFTIDPPTAKDLDDAISLERRSDGRAQIGVHVADVSHFVTEGTLLDQEARKRATTCYLDNRVYPMLPAPLSENVCSLLPTAPRLAFSVFFTMTADGRLLDEPPPVIHKTIIHSKCRLDYVTAQRVLDSFDHGPSPDGPTPPASLLHDIDAVKELECVRRVAGSFGIPEAVSCDLVTLSRIAQRRRERRLQDGAVTLGRAESECRLILGPDGIPEGVDEEEPSNLSHELVEELMILANHVVAKMLIALDPHSAILRRHKNAETKAIKSTLDTIPADIRRVVYETLGRPEMHEDSDGSTLEGGGVVRDAKSYPFSLQALLDLCKARLSPAAYQAASFAALTEFNPAEYFAVGSSTEDTWGLTASVYCRPLPFELKQLQSDCGQCNEKKKSAEVGGEDAQIDCRNLLFNAFLQKHHPERGWPYDGAVITSIIVPHSRDQDTEELRRRCAVVFFVPLLGQSRSLSFDKLGIDLLSVAGSGGQQEASASSEERVCEDELPGYVDVECAVETSSVESVRVQHVGGGGAAETLRRGMSRRVYLTPGTRRWSLSLAID